MGVVSGGQSNLLTVPLSCTDELRASTSNFVDTFDEAKLDQIDAAILGDGTKIHTSPTAGITTFSQYSILKAWMPNMTSRLETIQPDLAASLRANGFGESSRCAVLKMSAMWGNMHISRRNQWGQPTGVCCSEPTAENRAQGINDFTVFFKGLTLNEPIAEANLCYNRNFCDLTPGAESTCCGSW